METYVENWFDSEIAGKDQFRLVVESFKHEYEDFEKMLEVIEYCNESDVFIIPVNELTYKLSYRIKRLFKAFVEYIKMLFGKIEDLIKKFADKFKKKKNEDDPNETNNKTIEEDASGEVKIQKLSIDGKTYTIGKEYEDFITNYMKNSVIEPLKAVDNFIHHTGKGDSDVAVLEKVANNIVKIEQDWFSYDIKEMTYKEAKVLLEDAEKTKSGILEEISRYIKDTNRVCSDTIAILKNLILYAETPEFLDQFGISSDNADNTIRVITERYTRAMNVISKLSGSLLPNLSMLLNKFMSGYNSLKTSIDSINVKDSTSDEKAPEESK